MVHLHLAGLQDSLKDYPCGALRQGSPLALYLIDQYNLPQGKRPN